MPKIDERSPSPSLDDRASQRLREALDRAPVVAAWIFGSQASGKAGRLSDVDVGAWLDPELDLAARLDESLVLAQAARVALRTDEVDFVVLNDASPLLRHRAMTGRTVLVERAPRDRVRLETDAILEYLDTAPLRAELARGLEHRIAEDRFGRP